MKSSIVVPCHFTHIGHIYNLVKIYNKQSRLPYEMIFVCSMINTKQLFDAIDKIKTKVDDLNLSFLVHFRIFKNRHFAGLNRKIGSEMAKGDIIIFQDADDIPHKDRISIIEYFFQKYNPIFIGHHYIMRDYQKFKNIENRKKIDIKYSLHNNHYDKYFSHGNVAFIRDIVPHIHNWYENVRRTQDQKLNKYIMTKFKKSLIIHHPLLLYRDNYSTGYN